MSDDAVSGPGMGDPGRGDPGADGRVMGGPGVSASDGAPLPVDGAGEPGQPQGTAVPERIPPLGRTIAVYTVIRLGLIIVLTVLIALAGRPFGMPPIVALAFAIVLQLPLSVVMFRRQRSDLTAALARAKSKRTAERDRLFTELTGHEPQD